MKKFETGITKFVIRFVIVACLLAVVAIAAYAASVTCPVHPTSSTCYATGQYRYDIPGHIYQKWHCSCGDDVWVE